MEGEKEDLATKLSKQQEKLQQKRERKKLKKELKAKQTESDVGENQAVKKKVKMFY